MCSRLRWLASIVIFGYSVVNVMAQCPDRPLTGSIVADPLALTAQNGVLSAQLVMQHSVDGSGYTHYCYNYDTGSGIAEAPTLRVTPGDELDLSVVNRIQEDAETKKQMK